MGVTFLYPDSLRYLLDVKETLPLIGYAGRDLGALMKVHLRCWIDSVDTVPQYLTVDKETRLEDFIGQTCIIMVHFDWLLALNPLLCSSVYVAFKFFYHTRQYCTPRYPGVSPNPTLNSSVRVEQRVTTDFIDFIKGGSIEFEVFGKRRLPLASGTEGSSHSVGPRPPIASVGNTGMIKRTSLVESSPTPASSQSVEVLIRQLEESKANLRATEKQLQRSRKAAEGDASKKPTGVSVSVKEKERLRLIDEQLDQDNQEKHQKQKDERAAATEALLRQAQAEIQILKKQMEMYVTYDFILISFDSVLPCCAILSYLIRHILSYLFIAREIEEGRKEREKGNALALSAPKSQTCSLS